MRSAFFHFLFSAPPSLHCGPSAGLLARLPLWHSIRRASSASALRAWFCATKRTHLSASTRRATLASSPSPSRPPSTPRCSATRSWTGSIARGTRFIFSSVRCWCLSLCLHPFLPFLIRSRVLAGALLLVCILPPFSSLYFYQPTTSDRFVMCVLRSSFFSEQIFVFVTQKMCQRMV